MYKYTLCFIRKGNQILMLNRFFSPIMGKWNGIGGKLEEDETPYQCVIRETFEETGINIQNPELVGKVTWITEKGTSGMYVFIASVPTTLDFLTPTSVTEGILDWKEAGWILDVNNKGIANNIQEFLPIMLNGERFDHRYTFNVNEQIIDYSLLPLSV
ncbi:NUDIX hydrolase [Paenibacillus nasutitermitis]|uniref:7,8-dihydro-8-oxoguanine triphosphatase n=1 Tax=Paenibacillus nasutitermitis TaxID=1652958 RepID=A0A916YUP4_9BACL|nr:8-oxo-dGTP diphosphatase [Paenibacillus nasutitermitis]GGD61798.1 7,8-dihydro-8-oxoguanine triphosphatase [Paenibacillus nasutitermitis]